MAIAFDVATVATAYTATGTQTTSHVASASARGAVVLIDQNGTAADEVSGVAYGGTAMTRLGFDTEATEAGGVYIYWLDNVATGTQNVAMTTTAATNKQLVVATMTVASGQGVAVAGENTGTSASVANPSWSITGLTAATTLTAFEVIHSGLTTMTTTPAASWTLISSTDLGAQGRGFARQSVASSGTSLACGWTAATADDFVGSSVAFKEVAGPVTGTLATTLDDSGLDGAGEETITATLAATLDDAVLDAVATETVTGTLAATLDDSILAASCTVTTSGTPDTLGGTSLAAWFKADAITGFSDGASLTSWVDSSAKGNTVATVVGTAPVYRATGGPLGLPCVDHTVAAGGLNRTTATGTPAGDYTYFMVVQSGSTAIQSMMNGGTTSSFFGRPQIRLNALQVELDKSGMSAIKKSTAALASSTWTIVIVTFTSVGSVVHFDIGGTTEDYSVGGTTTFNTGNLAYGDYQGTAAFFNGKMAEIGQYSSVLSSGDLSSLKAYLTAKWVTGTTVTGTLASILDDSVLSASGSVTTSDVTGTLATVLDDAVLAAVAAETISGVLATTLDDSVLAASGTETIIGTLATTLDDAVLSAIAAETITGTLTATLDDAVLAASGTETIAATLATVLDDSVLAASGTAITGVSGTLAATLADALLAGSGTETITGTLAATLGDAILAATGTVIVPVTGTLATTLDGAVFAGTGTETITGSLAVTLDNATLAAVGTETLSGTLTAALDDAVLAAAGTVILTVTGTLVTVLADAELLSVGTETFTGTLTTTLDDAVLLAAVVMAGAFPLVTNPRLTLTLPTSALTLALPTSDLVLALPASRLELT